MREEFIHAAHDAITTALTPQAARRQLKHYLRLARDEDERTQIERYEEMLHMWETIPRRVRGD